MQNKRGERESPWKIPQLMHIPLAVKIPLEWESVRLVSQSFIDVLRKLITIGETLKVSKQRKIQEWEHYQKPSCNLSKQYSGVYVSFWHSLISFC